MDHKNSWKTTGAGIGALVAALLLSGLVLPAKARAVDAELAPYIVLLQDGVDATAIASEHELAYGADVSFIYRHALTGYAALLSEEAATLIAADLRVESVTSDGSVETLAQSAPTGVDRVYDPANANSTMSGLTIDGQDDRRVDADIAIIDTGIDQTHPDLDVVGGTDCTRATLSGTCVDGFSGDDNSHGTHVAGTAAALDNDQGVVGVAPGARLWAVDVLNSSGTSVSSLLAGVDWVTANAATIEVANISLACTRPCEEVNLAIKNSVAAGITYTIAAGNSGADATLRWPANSPDAITVSALADSDGIAGGLSGIFRCFTTGELDDRLAAFSNWGPVIDVAAPGVCIRSTVPSGYAYFSGTSMAAPHVAGAGALLASQAAYKGKPALIKQAIIEKGNYNWVDYYQDAVKEPLLEVTTFTPVTVSMKPNEAPQAGFTKSCSGQSCTFTSTSTDADGSIVSWSWQFGDGTTGSGSRVSHSYSAGGKFTITLTVVDDKGAASSSSGTVNCTSRKGTVSCR